MADDKRLRQIFERLDPRGREMLLEFAEFLHARSEPAPAELPEPVPMERPEGETVIAAIKRLSYSYPMVDKTSVLHQTSALMAQHMMQGRAAVEVIDELEILFEQQYRAMVERGDT
jgi:hypothetical protein